MNSYYSVINDFFNAKRPLLKTRTEKTLSSELFWQRISESYVYAFFNIGEKGGTKEGRVFVGERK